MNQQEESSPYLESRDTRESNTSINNDRRPKLTKEFPIPMMMGFVVLIIILIALWYFSYSYSEKESFTVAGKRSDPTMDESYLEDQLDILNRMQKKNMMS